MKVLKELRQRKVFQVAGAYLVISWLLVQVAASVEAPLLLPQWLDTLVIVLLAIGFPVALILTWGFETQPEKRDEPEPDRAVDPNSASDGADLSKWVAVLPLDNLSPDPDDAYFAAGIHEEILNHLAKIKDLSVIARTSVLRYRNAEKPITEIATELGVGTVMEGSVRYAGDRVRITAQLIEAASGAHLWSETYDREMADIFAIQSDIAERIAEALKAELSIEDRKALSAKPTENFEAYAHYLSAISSWRIGSPVKGAYEHLEAAKALDPNFARAFAASAAFHAVELSVMFPDQPRTPTFLAETAALARADAERALALNPDEPLAHCALAMTNIYDWNWEEAFREAETALRLGADLPLVVQTASNVAIWRGHKEEGIRLAQRSSDIDPRNVSMRMLYAARVQQAGRPEEASSIFLKLKKDFPNYGTFFWGLTLNPLACGDVTTAAEEARELARRIDDRSNSLDLGVIAFALGQSGDAEEAKKVFALLEERSASEHVPASVWYIAYAGIGELETALDWLHRAVDEKDDAVWFLAYLRWPADDLWWAPVRDHPRFIEARRKMGADV